MVGNVIAYNGLGPVGDPSEAAFNGVFISIGTGNAVYNNRIFGNGTLGILLDERVRLMLKLSMPHPRSLES